MSHDNDKTDGEPDSPIYRGADSVTGPEPEAAGGFEPGHGAPEAAPEAEFDPTDGRRSRTTIAEVITVLNMPQAQVPGRFAEASEVLSAFFLEIFEASRMQIEAVDGFEEFTLHEKLHAFFEAMLCELSPSRAFLPRLTMRLGAATVFDRRLAKDLRKGFVQAIAGFFSDAIQRGEIPDIDLDGSVITSLADYATTVVGFWLRDLSPQHRLTTEFIDQSLHVVLPAAISSARLRGLGSFMRRQVQGLFSRKSTAGESGFGAS